MNRRVCRGWSTCRRPRDDRADGGPAGNCRSLRWSDDICALTRQRNDAARCWSARRCCGNRRSGWGSYGCDRAGRYCGDVSWGRRCDDRSRTRRWSGFGGCFGLFALENRLQRVAGLGHLGEVELRLRLGSGLARSCAAVSAEVLAYLLCLVGLDGAGVGLSGHANCFECVQNGPALYFQFSCQIVDSNFAHPSLFASLRP